MNTFKKLGILTIVLLVFPVLANAQKVDDSNQHLVQQELDRQELASAWQEYNRSWSEFSGTFADVNSAWGDLALSWAEIDTGWVELSQGWDVVAADWHALEQSRALVASELGIVLTDSSPRISRNGYSRSAFKTIMQTVAQPTAPHTQVGTWAELNSAWDGLNNAWLHSDAAWAELETAWAEVNAAHTEISHAWTFVDPAFHQISIAFDEVDLAWANSSSTK